MLIMLALQHRPEHLRALFATSGQSPPGAWESVAEAMAPDAGQRALIRQL